MEKSLFYFFFFPLPYWNKDLISKVVICLSFNGSNTYCLKHSDIYVVYFVRAYSVVSAVLGTVLFCTCSSLTRVFSVDKSPKGECVGQRENCTQVESTGNVYF